MVECCGNVAGKPNAVVARIESCKSFANASDFFEFFQAQF